MNPNIKIEPEVCWIVLGSLSLVSYSIVLRYFGRESRKIDTDSIRKLRNARINLKREQSKHTEATVLMLIREGHAY